MSKGFGFLRFFLFLFFFLVSCDYSSQLHKEIIRAQGFVTDQKFGEAIEIYQRILKGSIPDNVRAKILYQLGNIYSIHLGKIKKSVEFYEKVKVVTSDIDWLLRIEERLGDVNFNYLNDYKKASENYLRLVNYYPLLENREKFQFRLGHAYLELKDFNKSITIFREIANNPKHAYYHSSFYYLAKNYFNQKNWASCVENLKKYLKTETRQEKIVDAKFFLGNVYETMESLEEAYDVYYSLLGEYPNTAVLKNRLKSLYTRRILRRR